MYDIYLLPPMHEAPTENPEQIEDSVGDTLRPLIISKNHQLLDIGPKSSQCGHLFLAYTCDYESGKSGAEPLYERKQGIGGTAYHDAVFGRLQLRN